MPRDRLLDLGCSSPPLCSALRNTVFSQRPPLLCSHHVVVIAFAHETITSPSPEAQADEATAAFASVAEARSGSTPRTAAAPNVPPAELHSAAPSAPHHRAISIRSAASPSAAAPGASDSEVGANGGGKKLWGAIWKDNKTADVAAAAASAAAADQGSDESEALQAFYAEIESIREDISAVKSCIEQIELAHQNALNVISEEQSAPIETENRRQAKERRGSGTGASAELRIRASQHGAVAKRFLDVMVEYKDVQKKYQDKYRQRMQRQYLIVKPTATADEVEKIVNGEQGPVFAQTLVHSGQKAEAKRALQDIRDRHADVQRMEKSILELQQLFIDMSVLVAAQGELINQIELHVEDAVDQTEQGVEALHKAVKIQKKSRKKLCVIILLLVLGCVIVGLGVYFGVIKK
ncbi:Syntaxin-1A [Cladochytrium tenue]|nr:Syntaxin-1A [Cladochytrium tenue]